MFFVLFQKYIFLFSRVLFRAQHVACFLDALYEMSSTPAQSSGDIILLKHIRYLLKGHICNELHAVFSYGQSRPSLGYMSAFVFSFSAGHQEVALLRLERRERLQPTISSLEGWMEGALPTTVPLLHSTFPVFFLCYFSPWKPHVNDGADCSGPRTEIGNKHQGFF